MCTVSVLPTAGGLRVVFNRDEQRTRPAELPPTVRVVAGTRCLLPVDPASQGTWLAVNEHGVAMALLNRSLKAQIKPVLSRGTIIPSLLASHSVEDAHHRLLSFRAADYLPFRLLLVSLAGCEEFESDGHHIRLAAAHSPVKSIMLASSGLGDEAALAFRQPVFEQMVLAAGCTAAAQDEFHRQHDATFGAMSVLMARADAMTVSRITLALTEREVRMRHQRVQDARDVGPATELVMPLTVAAGAAA